MGVMRAAESQEIADTARALADIARELSRLSSALAATLSLPDEIRPVLQAMEREGLVEIRTLKGWQLVSLTDRGRREAGSARREA